MTKQWLYDEILTEGIQFKQDSLPISIGGRRSNFLFDLKGLLLRKDFLENVTEIFWETYKDAYPFQIGAMELAGVPILGALINSSPFHDLNAFIVRKERKKTGMGNIIEGDIVDLPIIMIDDIFNSGNSLKRAREAIGKNIREIFVLINFENNENPGFKVNSLFKVSDFKEHIDKEVIDRTPSDLVDLNGKQITSKSIFLKVSRDIPGAGIIHVVPKSTPLIVGDTLYRGSDNGTFVALGAMDMVRKWIHKAPGTVKRKGIWSSPAFHDGIIYYGAYNGHCYALDMNTGEEIWDQHYCDWIGSSPIIVPEKNILLIGMEHAGKTVKGSMAALNLKTGELLWQTHTQELLHTTAAYDGNGTVVWGSSDNKVYALDIDTGAIKWEFIGGEKILTSVAIFDKVVAFGGFDHFIYLLDKETGNLIKKWETEHEVFCTPIFVRNYLVCGSTDGYVYIINLNTLEIEKRINTHKKIYNALSVCDYGIFVGTNNGTIYIFDLDTFELKDMIFVKDAVTNPITFIGNYIYVSTTMNDIYCFERINK